MATVTEYSVLWEGEIQCDARGLLGVGGRMGSTVPARAVLVDGGEDKRLAVEVDGVDLMGGSCWRSLSFGSHEYYYAIEVIAIRALGHLLSAEAP